MTWIVYILKMALPFLTTAQTALQNFDDNTEGWDDKIAKELQKAIDTIVVIITANDTGQARGYREIVVFGNSVIQAMSGIVTSDLPFSEKVIQLERHKNSLYDFTLVYQAQKGDDAAALQEFKNTANFILRDFTDKTT